MGIIALVKVTNIVSGYVVQKQFVAIHSMMNKVTGALLFVFPMAISFIDLRYSATVVCIIATFAAVQEGHFIRTKQIEWTSPFAIQTCYMGELVQKTEV